MPKLTVEIDLDSDPIHAGDQVNDVIRTLICLREVFWGGEPVANQSDVILDTVDGDELIGNYRVD